MIGKGWVAMREDTALFRLVKIGSAWWVKRANVLYMMVSSQNTEYSMCQLTGPANYVRTSLA